MVSERSSKETSTTQSDTLSTLIAYCANKPILCLTLIALLAGWGYASLRDIPLDAIPDVSDTQVIIHTEWPGRSPDLIEDQVTYPLTTALLSVPAVKVVRGQSVMGSSFVYAIFDDDTDIYWARTRVLEYINAAKTYLPSDATTTLGPDATGVGWIFQYALVDKTGNMDLSELRAFQDFTLKYWLMGVEGVAEVASVGGYVKEYQVHIDPFTLAQLSIPVDNIISAIRRSNSDLGGRVIEISGHEHIIRGRGYIQAKDDLLSVVIGTDTSGMPLLLSQVAKVTLGPASQRGLAELDGEGLTVGGIVVMRYGENALSVIDGVKDKIASIQSSLPDGVELVITYDRSALIKQAIATLKTTLIQEMLVVALVIFIFLLHVRSALVACITLPIAILLAFIPMKMQGLTANIMSLGGIAVAIGAMVDAAVVMVDNVHRALEKNQGRSPTREVVINAMQAVGPSIFFSLLIITVSFLPVFALEETEGRLFGPLALTKTYSMGFAAILSVTLIPALAALFVRKQVGFKRSPLDVWLTRLFVPVIYWGIKARWWALCGVVAALVFTVPIFKALDSEFMPPLNEGSILYMPTALPGMSIEEASNVLQRMDTQIKAFPEVDHVFGKAGRSTSATDSAPLSMIETVITLKPKNEWRDGVTWDSLIAELDSTLRYPGMPNLWWMPIQTRTEMLSTGIRSTLGIKVFGDELTEVEAAAVAIESALAEHPATAPFTRSVFAERLTGGYFLDFVIDRHAASRYGLNIQDVQDALAVATGGVTATTVLEGRERYPVTVRYGRDQRASVEALNNLRISTPAGQQIPIQEVASIQHSTGAPMIRNENGSIVGYVFIDLNDGIGAADFVALAQDVLAQQVNIPTGYRVEWAGQFQYFERAKARLRWVVPGTLLIVMLLLYVHRQRFADVCFVLLAMPLALMGSFSLLYMLDYRLSVAVWVGIIAMAGLAAEMGLLMLYYLTQVTDTLSRQEGTLDIDAFHRAIARGASGRVRPMLMTGLTLALSLIPILLGDSTGSDVMKRIAAPMVGGTFTGLLGVLILFPAFFVLWKAPGLVEKGKSSVVNAEG